MSRRPFASSVSLLKTHDELLSSLRKQKIAKKLRGLPAWAMRKTTRATSSYERRYFSSASWPDDLVPTLKSLPSEFVTPYSLAPSSLLWLRTLVRDLQPNSILECGSGISTIVVAASLPSGHSGASPTSFVSLEGDLDWLRVTADALEATGLAQKVGLQHAPLALRDFRGRAVHSFDVSRVPTSAPADLVFIDAPPHSVGRLEVLPGLLDNLSEGAIVVLDDSAREAEHEAIDQWISAGLATLVGYAPVGSGLGVLRCR